MKLIELLKKGNVDKISSIPKHISMAISDIFIFDDEDVVLKIYKKEDGLEFKNEKEYLKFILDDFEWNKIVSPDVYLNLVELEEKDEKLFFKPFDLEKSKNAVIVMNKIDDEKNLLNLFLEKKMEKKDFAVLGIEFGKIKKEANKHKLPKKYENIDLYGKYMNELSLKLERIPTGFLGAILRYLKKYIYENKKYFGNIYARDFKMSIDCNIGNLIFKDEKLKIIDSCPPKEEWRYSSREIDFYRLGADIYFLFGKEYYDYFMDGLKSQIQLDKKHERFYLLYGAMISYPYFYHLGSKDEKYKKLVWKYQRNLKKYFFGK